MSFSFSVPESEVSDSAVALASALEKYTSQFANADAVFSDSAKESIQAAFAAIETIIASGVVGSDLFTASISGHANPGHVPTPGWGNDFVSIVINAHHHKAPEAVS